MKTLALSPSFMSFGYAFGEYPNKLIEFGMLYTEYRNKSFEERKRELLDKVYEKIQQSNIELVILEKFRPYEAGKAIYITAELIGALKEGLYQKFPAVKWVEVESKVCNVKFEKILNSGTVSEDWKKAIEKEGNQVTKSAIKTLLCYVFSISAVSMEGGNYEKESFYIRGKRSANVF